MRKEKEYDLNRIFLFDFYYGKILLKNFFLFFILFVVVYFFSIFLAQVPSLLRRASYNEFITVQNILKYYAFLIPKIINQTISFSFLFSVSYSLGNFYAHNEALILVSSGVSVLRISFFNILLAVCIAFFLIIANTTFFSDILFKAQDFSQKLGVDFLSAKDESNNFLEDSNGNYYFAKSIDVKQTLLNDFLIVKQNLKSCESDQKKKDFIDSKAFNLLTSSQKRALLLLSNQGMDPCFGFEYAIRGKSLKYDYKIQKWVAKDGYYFDFKKESQNKVVPYTNKIFNVINLDFHYLNSVKQDIDTMNIIEAMNYRKALFLHQEPLENFTVEFLDVKFLKPLSLIFLAFFAIFLGRFFSRKHFLIYSLAFSFITTFAFLIMVNIGYSLAKSKILPIWIGVLLGYIMGIILILILSKRQKT